MNSCRRSIAGISYPPSSQSNATRHVLLLASHDIPVPHVPLTFSCTHPTPRCLHRQPCARPGSLYATCSREDSLHPLLQSTKCGMLDPRAAETVHLPNSGDTNCHLPCIQVGACLLTHISDGMRLARVITIILTITHPTHNASTLPKIDALWWPPHKIIFHPKHVQIILTVIPLANERKMPATPPLNSQSQFGERTTHNALLTHVLLCRPNDTMLPPSNTRAAQS